MDTNPNAAKILCFGDSNTWGTRPDTFERYTTEERWPCLLQQILGDNFHIIEEGLGGRTTDLESPDPDKPGRNGFTYFKTCFESFVPLYMVIIMLGINDLKTVFNRSAKDVANALRQYPDFINQYCTEHGLESPKILLISPTWISKDNIAFNINAHVENEYDEKSIKKSQDLAEEIKKVADETGSLFFDAYSTSETGLDGLHFTPEAHQNLAESLATFMKSD